MNTVIETIPAATKPIDINYLSKYGLPVRYGNKSFVLSGKKLASLVLAEFGLALKCKLNGILN